MRNSTVAATGVCLHFQTNDEYFSNVYIKQLHIMLETNASSSGTSLLGPSNGIGPQKDVIWFQNVIPEQQVSQETEAPEGTPPSWQMPPAPLYHRLIMLTAVFFPFAALIYGIAISIQGHYMSTLDLTMMLVGWVATGMGVTIGFHRLLAHRAFEAYYPVRFFWMMLGSLSVEGSPLTWCSTHRRHHEMSDKPGDPHTPHLHGDETVWDTLRGLVYAHFGWLFTGYWNDANRDRYIPDLIEDRAMVTVDKLYYLWVLMSMAIPAIIAGAVTQTWQGTWNGFLWGGLVRIFLTHHVTWSINSICHVYGARDFKSYDESRNNPIFGILAFGEGWHNNHHAFPTSARHGLKWWQFDSSWVVIRTMALLGLAWNVKVPTARQLASRKL